MGVFDLPSNWVYIEYEDGTRKNIANTDTLSYSVAFSFYKDWYEEENKIVKMTLETSDGKVLKTFDFE